MVGSMVDRGRLSTRKSSTTSSQKSLLPHPSLLPLSPPEDGAVTNQNGSVDAQSLCIDLLVNGLIDSFVDLFLITSVDPSPVNTSANDAETVGKKKDANVAAADESRSSSARSKTYPNEVLVSLSRDLGVSETSRRRGDLPTAFGAYERLAAFFTADGDPQSAIYFGEKMSEVSELIAAETNGGRAGGADGNERIDSAVTLGDAYKSLGDHVTAVKYYETAQHITLTTSKDSQTRRMAADRLLSGYQLLAKHMIAQAEPTSDNPQHVRDLIEVYQKTLRCAESINATRATADAYRAIGESYITLSDPSNAVTYFQSYLSVSKTLNDAPGQCTASALLADTFAALGDQNLSVIYYENTSLLASQHRQTTAYASAESKIGAVYSSKGEHTRAAEYCERAFAAVRTESTTPDDRQRIDDARIRLGMTRAQCSTAALISTLLNETDPTLIAWKLQRIPFKKIETETIESRRNSSS